MPAFFTFRDCLGSLVPKTVRRLFRQRFIRFAAVGVGATATHAGTTMLLIDGLGMGSATLATAIGTLAGVAASYLGNRAWTFQATPGQGGSHARVLPRFLVAYSVTMGFNSLVMYVLADRLRVFYLIPLVATLLISPFLNYTLNRRFVFPNALST